MAPRKPPKAPVADDPKPARAPRPTKRAAAPPTEAAEPPAETLDGVAEWSATRARGFAIELFGDLEKLRAQLFDPVVHREAKVVAGGQGQPNKVQIVEIELNEPTFADKKVIVQAIAIGVEQVMTLISGTEKGHKTTPLDELRQKRGERLARKSQPRRTNGAHRNSGQRR